MDATLSDLKWELWLRRRDAGKIIWTTRQGKKVPINQMSDTHLVNTINMIVRNEEQKRMQKEWEEEFYANAMDCIGDDWRG